MTINWKEAGIFVLALLVAGIVWGSVRMAFDLPDWSGFIVGCVIGWFWKRPVFVRTR